MGMTSAKTMAEVLGEHVIISHGRTGTYACTSPDCGWEIRYWGRTDDLMRGVDVVAREFAAHQAMELANSGYGDVREARAGALEDAADELARLPYAKPDALQRPEYERLLAVRRGNTDKWLRDRAAAARRER